MGRRVFSIAWKVMGKPILVLLHNLGMSLLVIWISFFRSTTNQILLSVAAVIYWVLGCVLIYRVKKT